MKWGVGRDEKRIPKLDHVGDGNPRLPPQLVERVERNGSPPPSIHRLGRISPFVQRRSRKYPSRGRINQNLLLHLNRPRLSASDSFKRLSSFLSSTNFLSTSPEVTSPSTHHRRHGRSPLLTLPGHRPPRVEFSGHGRGSIIVNCIITDPSS
jgi:hypothetical protein